MSGKFNFYFMEFFFKYFPFFGWIHRYVDMKGWLYFLLSKYQNPSKYIIPYRVCKLIGYFLFVWFCFNTQIAIDMGFIWKGEELTSAREEKVALESLKTFSQRVLKATPQFFVCLLCLFFALDLQAWVIGLFWIQEI